MPTHLIPDNGIVERFHKTALDEFYRIAFRKKIYGSTAELQADLDDWVRRYNIERAHQGRWCFGKTPMQTFLDARPLAQEKFKQFRRVATRFEKTARNYRSVVTLAAIIRWI